MKKPEGQEGAPDSETREPRKLNMEEKRKLEKLLLADIDSALARYDAQAQDMRGNLIDKLTKNPPADVKKLFDSYVLARKQVGQLEAKLDTLGFDVTYDGALRVNTHGTMTAQLKAFDELAKNMRDSLQTLKRSYCIKLFADHADTQSLFASLAKDLERLIG
jgi:2-oxoglutarate dehydrogenase complex dehydrogenase (E1) component-like enzyme